MRALSLLTTLALAAGLTGCASLCDRKATWFEGCRGTSVVHSDPLCEDNLGRCSGPQKAAFQGYVECLEAQTQCSMESMQQCAAAHPAGVNLMCNG